MKLFGLAFIKYEKFIQDEVNQLSNACERDNKKHRMFATQDEAAMGFIKYNNPRTHHDNRERGSYIYKAKANGHSVYFYLNESPGAHDNIVKHAIFDFVFGMIFNYKGQVISFRPTAFVHTHPSCACHAGDVFSKQDMSLISLPGISAVYLGSPKGILYAYEGDVKGIRVVSEEMPFASFKFADGSFIC